MKYLIFLALVVQAFTEPITKPDIKLVPKTSHPPSTGNVHRVVSGLPPNDIPSRPPSPGGQLVTQKVPEILRPATLKKMSNPPSTNGPRPAGGSSNPGKPPAVGTTQSKIGQDTKFRSRRHLKDFGSHPTGAPHLDHTLHGVQDLFHVTKLGSKRHMKGLVSHPTGAPHQSRTPHTHHSEASHPPKVTYPANGTPQKHGQGKDPQHSHGK